MQGWGEKPRDIKFWQDPMLTLNDTGSEGFRSSHLPIQTKPDTLGFWENISIFYKAPH